MVSAKTTTESLAIQPLEAVARAVYIPGIPTCGSDCPELKPCGPDQTIVHESGTTFADKVTVFCKQDRLPPVTASDGAVVSAATNAAAVSAQPFNPMAMTEYIPAAVTNGLLCPEEMFCGPDHSNTTLAG